MSCVKLALTTASDFGSLAEKFTTTDADDNTIKLVQCV